MEKTKRHKDCPMNKGIKDMMKYQKPVIFLSTYQHEKFAECLKAAGVEVVKQPLLDETDHSPKKDS